jgi:hypothetical protein
MFVRFRFYILLLLIIISTCFFFRKDLSHWIKKENLSHPRLEQIQAAGSPVTRLGMIDRVGLYQKNGRVEPYGVEVHQIPVGPISIGKTELHMTEDLSVLVWFPDRVSMPGESFLTFKLAKNTPEVKKDFFIGIITDKGPLLFGAKDHFIVQKQSDLDLPDDIKNLLSLPVIPWQESEKRQNYTTPPLTNHYKGGDLEASPHLKVKAIFIIAQKMKGKVIEIDHFQISNSNLSQNSAKVASLNLLGEVQGAKIPAGDYVYLRTEDNELQKTQINMEGQFVFPDVKVGSVVSIWYPYQAMDHYTQLGRWLSIEPGCENVTIDLSPEYLNVTGALVDPKSYKFVGKKKPAPQDNDYEPHARMAWHGSGIIQCYESFPFTNNLGYLDRDRRPDNPQKCLRIVHVGGSSSAALQVKTCEKFNILLEQELGIRLGRCVEVISAARDNGDIGTHYKRIKYFSERFKPDLILIENLSGLMMQIQPELLQKLHGFDFEHNIFPHFYYNADGNLTFADLSPDYAFFMHKKDLQPLRDDVPLVQSLSVPYDAMHPLAKDAWRYLKDILKYYQTECPNQKFALHTGIDFAQWRQPCKNMVSSKNYVYGPEIFVENHQKFCQKENILCFDPEINEAHNHPDTLLTFQYDGHYSPRGHQWLAKELGRLLEAHFKKEHERGV